MMRFAFVNRSSDYWKDVLIDSDEVEEHLWLSVDDRVVWEKKNRLPWSDGGIGYGNIAYYITIDGRYPYFRYVGDENKFWLWKGYALDRISDFVVIECDDIHIIMREAANLVKMIRDISDAQWQKQSFPLWQEQVKEWKAEYNVLRNKFFSSIKYGDRYDTGSGPEYP